MEHTAARTTGKTIVAYLVTRGIRQTWLARQIGLTPVQLNRSLHGTDGAQLHRDQVEAMADALDVNAATRKTWLSLLSTSNEAA